MDSRLELSNIMTPAPYYVNADDALSEAAKALKTHNVRHLPVKSGDTVMGVITDRDIGLARSLAKHAVDEESLTVADVCRTDPYTVNSTERVDRVLNYMAQNKIGSAIVLREGDMIGIITTTDICRVCGQFLEDFLNQTSS